MARLRWVKSLEQVKRDAERSPEFLSSTVRSLRVVYETSPALAAAVIPKPLVASSRPEVCATFSHVAMHITPEYTLEIGSAVFGVRASYDGVEGIWLLTMPMTSERATAPDHGELKSPTTSAEGREDFRQRNAHGHHLSRSERPPARIARPARTH
jgi:acetoacetate decarboxylase